MRAGLRVNLITFSLAVLALGVGLAPAATFDASYFGFSTNAANNFTAMRALESYANSNGTVAVVFQPGTYIVSLPISGELLYRGVQRGACEFTRVTGVSIDAANAEFYTTNLNSSEQSIFRFKSCTNITVNAQFRGLHIGMGTGIKSVHLVSSNTAATLNIKSTRMWDGVRIGDYADPLAAPTYEGNNNITVIATNTDTYYGVVANLAKDLNIMCESIGTSVSGFGAHRSVYIAGCTNVVVRSYFLNLNVPDGCNLITSAPSGLSPHHFGSSNVTLYATDIGSTNNVKFQSVAKLGVVTSSVSATNIVHKHIQIQVNAPSTATVRTNNYTIAIGSLGTGAAHVFEDITLSGTVQRGPSNTQPTIYIESNLVGLSRLQLALNRFYDAINPTQYTISCDNTSPAVDIAAIDSDVNLVYLAAPARQTFQILSQRPPPPTGLQVLILDPSQP